MRELRWFFCQPIFMAVLSICSTGLIFLLASQSLGQTSASPESLGLAPNELKAPLYFDDPNLQSTVDGYLKFEAFKYPTPIPTKPKLSQNSAISANLRVQYDSLRIENVVDFRAGRYLEWGGSIFGVDELFSSVYLNDKRVQVAVGRKEFWSTADQEWKLGLWQPLDAPDMLRAETGGLTGIFYKYKEDKTDLLVFGSPIFIPTMGPEIRAKNGTLESENRWYKEPSQSFPMSGTDTKLVYSMDMPDLAELIRKPGVGARARYGQDREGIWYSGSYGYKPINKLLVKYKRYLFLPETDPQTGEVTVGPDVGYHQILGGDIGYLASQSRFTLSYLEDRPKLELPTGSWVRQQPRPMRVLCLVADTDANLPYFVSPVGVVVSYLRIQTPAILDYDAEGVEQGSIFEDRSDFTSAVSLKVKTETQLLRKRLTSQVKYIRDFDQSGVLINGEVSIWPARQMSATLGVDILGVDNPEKSARDGRFLNQFRYNDRMYGGVSYVF